jgi:hypothetical protein
MDEGMIIIEAKERAADKMDSGKKHTKKHKKRDPLCDELDELLDNWDDVDHPYYKDVEEVVKKYKDGDEEEKETEEEVEEEDG